MFVYKQNINKNLLFLQLFFHKFGLADLRKMAGNQLPFHRLELPEPTNQLLCCIPTEHRSINRRGQLNFSFVIYILTFDRIISGAKYSGVPHNVQVLPFTRLANPKSVI